jgi:peptidoglycan/xylan/chitin deacetylase (PgdA/CDA1 family)
VIDPRALLQPRSAVVFLFHGVLRARRDTGVRNYTGKHLPLEEFEAFLDELAPYGIPLSIAQVADGAAGVAPLPDRGFAITFDDGFANNLHAAVPALERRGIPAAFYVTTDFVDRQACSWIDLIEYAVDRAGDARLELPFVDTGLATTAEKIAALNAIRQRAKSDSTLDPYALADEIWKQLDVRELVPDEELDRKLTWDEVRTLADHPLFTIGGHGATHRILSHVDSGELEREIDGALDRIAAETGQPALHFSYPEGVPGTFSQGVVQRLRRRGALSAVAVEPGAVRGGDDVYALKRTLVA